MGRGCTFSASSRRRLQTDHTTWKCAAAAQAQFGARGRDRLAGGAVRPGSSSRLGRTEVFAGSECPLLWDGRSRAYSCGRRLYINPASQWRMKTHRWSLPRSPAARRLLRNRGLWA